MSHIDISLERAIGDAARTEGNTSRETPDLKSPRARVGRFSWRAPLLAGAALIAMAAAGQFGWHYWNVGRFQESTDDAYVQADNTVIAPKVPGYVGAVLVDDNQPVRAGQPLARIDDRDYRVALAQANAGVAAARADIDNARASLDQQQAEVARSRSVVAVDQARLTFTEQDNDRYVTLARTGAGSVQNEQQAVSRLRVARATLLSDQAAVTAAERRGEMLRAQLAKAEASLEHDQAVRDQAALNLSYATIVAPRDGVIANRTLRAGQYVQAGTQLMAVVPTSAVYVVANFKETQLTDVRAGQKVTIGVDMFPDASVHGHVDSVAPAAGQEFALLPPDNATGNFTKVVQRIPVKITLDPDDKLAGLLRPGMSVTPVVDTRTAAAN